MAKRKGSITNLPGKGVSAKLTDYLAAGGPSARPKPRGLSTGKLPRNKRK